MTQPDFRALCAELADRMDSETAYRKPDGTRWTHPAVARAGAALATPPPEPPTDEELDSLWDEEAGYFNLYKEARIFARATLERWAMSDASPSTSLKVSLAVASQLRAFLTFRQMRRLCQRHRIRQYSYLAKDEMAMIIALDMINKLSRKHYVSRR